MRAPEDNGNEIRVHAVIPVRMASQRLPGKPLLQKTGKYLVEHVWQRVREARRIEGIVVATDDERIFEACRSFGADVVMTSSCHRSGTDRVAEVARMQDMQAVLNVQGDEPEIDPAALDRLADVLRGGAEMVTLAAPIEDEAVFRDPNAVKVVISKDRTALYFSRAPIPYRHRSGDLSAAFLHVGIYGYSRFVLERMTEWPPSPLETLERLEQLRALDNGVTIRVERVDHASPGVDTMEDYERFIERWQSRTGSTSPTLPENRSGPEN